MQQLMQAQQQQQQQLAGAGYFLWSFFFPNTNDLFSIATMMLDYNTVRIKLQNTMAPNRH